MRHIIWKPYWNYEKEERWLNDLASKGLALISYSWCRYVFEDAEAGAYIYRIELLDNTTRHPESQKYLAFLNEAGIECVASYMRWVYLRKKAADGPFNLYSDIDSKIAQYRKIAVLWLVLGISEVLIGGANVLSSLLEQPLTTFNLVIGCFLLAAGAAFFGIGLPIFHKMRRLKKERAVRES